MRSLSLILALLSVFPVDSTAKTAEWNPRTDLRLGLNGRTYPIGAQITATGGIGQALWGDLSTWKYGYTRIAVNLATSAVVNRAGLEFQLFPISILGFGVGYDAGVRNFTPKVIDCTGVECNGLVTRRFLRMQFVAAYHDFAFSLLGRYEELRAPEAHRPFFDEITLIKGNQNGEQVLTWTPILLYTLNPKWQVGGAALYSHALDTGGNSLLYGAVGAYKPDLDWSIIGGMGLNNSPMIHSAVTGFFMISWMIKPGLSILDQDRSKAQSVSESPRPSSKN